MAKKSDISKKKSWVLILASLADDIVILAVVFGLLWLFNVKFPWWVWVLICLALGAFVFVRTWAVIPSLHRKNVIGTEAMIGMTGEVVQPLKPNGVVKVEVEYWKAKCQDEHIDIGEQVEIISVERLKLEVRRKVL